MPFRLDNFNNVRAIGKVTVNKSAGMRSSEDLRSPEVNIGVAPVLTWIRMRSLGW